jgi:membrane protein
MEKVLNLWFDHALSFAAYVGRRFSGDQCLRVAASLSYTSLLAIVPLSAIGFALLAAFPGFEGFREQLETFVFSNLLPSSVNTVKGHLDSFVGNVGGLTGLGVIGLGVTAMLLLATIETVMNVIFRVRNRRAVMSRVLMYWAVLSLGPVLMGASLSLSTYIFALTKWTGMDAFSGPFGVLLRFSPMLISFLAFTLFYVAIPNRPVRLLHALAGSIVAGLLFAALKKGFGFYVGISPVYQTLYGAMAAIPVFLVWMYLSWTVVLVGAEVAASMSLWGRLDDAHGSVGEGMREKERLALAFAILAVLIDASRTGGGLRRAALIKSLDADEESIDGLLDALRKTGFAEVTEDDRWVMARDPDHATLLDLSKALSCGPIQAIGKDDSETPWRKKFDDVMAKASANERDLMAVSLRDLVANR